MVVVGVDVDFRGLLTCAHVFKLLSHRGRVSDVKLLLDLEHDLLLTARGLYSVAAKFSGRPGRTCPGWFEFARTALAYETACMTA